MDDRRADAGTQCALSLPLKSSSDTTRTIEAQNCPLDFTLRQSRKSQSAMLEVVKRKRDGERETERNRTELTEIERMQRAVKLILESGWLA